MPFTPEVASNLIRRTITALAGDDVANKMLRSIESVWGLTRQNTTSDPPVNRDIVITAVTINVRGGFERDAAITIFDKQKRVGTLTSAQLVKTHLWVRRIRWTTFLLALP